MSEAIVKANMQINFSKVISVGDDAELLVNCKAWISEWSAMQAASSSSSEQYYIPTATFDEDMQRIRAAICDTRAETLAGLAAKASVIKNLGYDCQEITASLCIDLNRLQTFAGLTAASL